MLDGGLGSGLQEHFFFIVAGVQCRGLRDIPSVPTEHRFSKARLRRSTLKVPVCNLYQIRVPHNFNLSQNHAWAGAPRPETQPPLTATLVDSHKAPGINLA